MVLRPAFTLLEPLLVAAILAVLVGLSSAVATQAIRNGEFDRARSAVRDELVSARTDTIGGTSDDSWGVAFTAHGITRYKGASYAARAAGYDLATVLSDDVRLTGSSEVAFRRPSGAPAATATIIITNGINSATATVDSLGAVTLQ